MKMPSFENLSVLKQIVDHMENKLFIYFREIVELVMDKTGKSINIIACHTNILIIIWTNKQKFFSSDVK